MRRDTVEATVAIAHSIVSLSNAINIPFFGSYKYLHGPGVFESGRHTQHGWESQSVGTDHEHPGSHLC